MPAPVRPATSVEVQARAMFTRVLSAWASDLLALRRSGLDVPGQRAGRRDVVMPSFGEPQGEPRWAGAEVAAGLRWRPAAA